MVYHNVLSEKMKESVLSVLPITLIVAILCIFFIPIDSGLMLSFLIGSIMIIVGMGLFTLGSELSMTQIGNHIGAKMTKSRKLGLSSCSVSFWGLRSLWRSRICRSLPQTLLTLIPLS